MKSLKRYGIKKFLLELFGLIGFCAFIVLWHMAPVLILGR